MKSQIFIVLFTFFSVNIYCQVPSPALDVLIDSSKVIVQGVILKKYCNQPMDVQSCVGEKCVITMTVENIIKGNPLISVLEAPKYVYNNSTQAILYIDTIKGLCFEHNRWRFPFITDTLNRKPDYHVLVGDNVIVFLGGHDRDPYRRIRTPDDWIIYKLIDTYLGVITANDYVIEYIKNKLKVK